MKDNSDLVHKFRLSGVTVWEITFDMYKLQLIKNTITLDKHLHNAFVDTSKKSELF
jgi:hypothetical protein